MKTFKALTLALGLVAPLALAAGPASAEDALKVAMGQINNWENQAPTLGQDAGFFKKHGLVLDVVGTQGAGETIQAVISGSADIGGGVGAAGVMRAFSKGAPVRILSPASIELMGTNVIPKDVLLNTNGSVGLRFNEAVGFGLDFQVDKDPRAAGSLEGKNTMSWGGAAGTWFWIDPTNDVLFVGMIQRMGGTGGDDLGTMARTLTYQALLHPEK